MNAPNTPQPITITGSVSAWIGSSYSMKSFIRALEENDQAAMFDCVHFCSGDMDKGTNPWTRVGTAEITLAIHSRDTVVAAAVATLKQELDHARAEWLTKQGEIMGRINELQALEYVA
jgi:hypothetical protein